MTYVVQSLELYVDASRHYYTVHLVVKDIDPMHTWHACVGVGTRNTWCLVRVCVHFRHMHVFCMLH